MVNPSRALLGTVMLVMAPNIATAVCTDSDLRPGWHWNYDGTIGGKYRLRLTLTDNHGDISGLYFYSTQL
jgi:hypothetical protein